MIQHTRREFTKIALGATLATGTTACSQTLRTHSAPSQNDPDPNVPLKILAEQKGLRFGTEIGNGRNGPLFDAEYMELVKRECNILVAGNEHKLYTILPQPDQYSFQRGDALVEFALNHNIPMRGHTLLWNNKDFIPSWLSSYDFGADERAGMRKFLRDYISTVCTHYGEDIKSWDVVNEAVGLVTGRIRNTIFTQLAGGDLVEYCFELAREYAPHAQLVYNDFPIWERGRGTHRNGVLRLLERLTTKNIPIDAVGIQGHLGASVGSSNAGYPDPQRREWRAFIDEIAGMGFDILITEFDVNDTKLTADIAERDLVIADYGRAFLDMMLDYPQVKDVLAWGLSDRHTWLQRWRPRKDGLRKRPTLYDEQLQPKPLRQAVARAIYNAPVRS